MVRIPKTNKEISDRIESLREGYYNLVKEGEMGAAHILGTVIATLEWTQGRREGPFSIDKVVE